MAKLYIILTSCICIVADIATHAFRYTYRSGYDCKIFGICDTDSDYPTALAKQLIRELKANNTKFTNEELSDVRKIHNKPKIVYHRFRYRIAFTPPANIDILCEAFKTYFRPKKATNQNNIVKTILNDDEKPVQTFRYEKCMYPNSACSEYIVFLPTYYSECVQKWALREMYYITENGTSAKDYFKVPTCCSCKYKHKD